MLLLSILLISILAQADDFHDYQDDPSDEYDDDTSSIVMQLGEANQQNCTQLKKKHKGFKVQDFSLRPSSTLLPTTTSTPEDLKNLKSHEKDENAVKKTTTSLENEATEKRIKDVNLNKQSTGDLSSSENVTVHQNYSIVKKYPPTPSRTDDKEELKNTTLFSTPVHNHRNEYNWYQIISKNGGVPGEVNATMLTPNVTEVLYPCERPINVTEPPLEDLLYKYEMIEFEKSYRREDAFLRFAGTESEFVDIHGHFVWSPPGHCRHYYYLEYRKDDTGFYIQLHKQHKCEFTQNPVTINCRFSEFICECYDDGIEHCYKGRSASLEPALTAALLGSG